MKKTTSRLPTLTKTTENQASMSSFSNPSSGTAAIELLHTETSVLCCHQPSPAKLVQPCRQLLLSRGNTRRSIRARDCQRLKNVIPSPTDASSGILPIWHQRRSIIIINANFSSKCVLSNHRSHQSGQFGLVRP